MRRAALIGSLLVTGCHAAEVLPQPEDHRYQSFIIAIQKSDAPLEVFADRSAATALNVQIEGDIEWLGFDRSLEEIGLVAGPIASAISGTKSRSLPSPQGIYRGVFDDRHFRWEREEALSQAVEEFRFLGPDAEECANIGACLGNDVELSGERICISPCPAHDEPLPPDPPAAPIGPTAPEMTPCPRGWIESDPTGTLPICEPPEWQPVRDCNLGEAQFYGEPECSPIGTPCSSGDWADGLPDDGSVLFVRPGASPGGDGTRGAPLDRLSVALETARMSGASTIAIAKGELHEEVAIDRSITLRGACARDTHVIGSGDGPILDVREGTLSIRDLHLFSPLGSAVVARGFGEIDFRGVDFDAGSARVIWAHEDSTVVGQRARIHGGIGVGLTVGDRASADISAIVFDHISFGLYVDGGGGTPHARTTSTAFYGDDLWRIHTGVVVLAGGRMEMKHARFDVAGPVAIHVEGGNGHADIEDVAIRATETSTALVVSQASLDAQTLLIENSLGGLFTADTATIAIHDAVLRSVHENRFTSHGTVALDHFRLENVELLNIGPNTRKATIRDVEWTVDRAPAHLYANLLTPIEIERLRSRGSATFNLGLGSPAVHIADFSSERSDNGAINLTNSDAAIERVELRGCTFACLRLVNSAARFEDMSISDGETPGEGTVLQSVAVTSDSTVIGKRLRIVDAHGTIDLHGNAMLEDVSVVRNDGIAELRHALGVYDGATVVIDRFSTEGPSQGVFVNGAKLDAKNMSIVRSNGNAITADADSDVAIERLRIENPTQHAVEGTSRINLREMLIAGPGGDGLHLRRSASFKLSDFVIRGAAHGIDLRFGDLTVHNGAVRDNRIGVLLNETVLGSALTPLIDGVQWDNPINFDRAP